MLTYGLSSEYLKSTKEAQAKSKAPDADRSLYRCGGTERRGGWPSTTGILSPCCSTACGLPVLAIPLLAELFSFPPARLPAVVTMCSRS